MGNEWNWAGAREEPIPQIGPRLILVDIENLCGEPRPSVKRISAAKKFLDALVGADTSVDKYVIGCHHTIQKAVETTWNASGTKNWEVRVRSGKDGADLALGAWLSSNVATLTNFNSLVIGSGDHFFADKAFVKMAYEKFNPNHILQVASSPISKSHKFEEFKHHVAYFSDVHPAPISLLPEEEVDAVTKRYVLLGRKLLGVKAFKDTRKPVSARESASPNRQGSFMNRFLENRELEDQVDASQEKKLVRDGIEFEFVNWFRNYDWEFNDRVYLSSETMALVKLADTGETIVATDSEGLDITYVVS
jgi:hypothetical protein